MDQLPRKGYLLALNERNEEAARRYNVVSDIHCQDYIFNALYFLSKNDFDEACFKYYKNGLYSAEKVKSLIDARYLGKEPKRILDFASGFGCVSRHFKNVMPDVSLTAMDIHKNAYYFNTGHLGVEAILSDEDPAKAKVEEPFDVVFALSFFSHMPDRTFGIWLEKIASFVKIGGLMIFTTHGEKTHRDHIRHIEVNANGHGFIADSEQFDLDTKAYGHAITYEKYVREKISKIPNVDILEITPGDWWAHQDTFVLQKITGKRSWRSYLGWR